MDEPVAQGARRGIRGSDPVQSDDQFFAQGLKMAAVAVVSAVLTATVVIGVGRSVMERPGGASAQAGVDVVRVSTR